MCMSTLNIYVKYEVAHNSPTSSCNDSDFNQHALKNQVKYNLNQAIISFLFYHL